MSNTMNKLKQYMIEKKWSFLHASLEPYRKLYNFNQVFLNGTLTSISAFIAELVLAAVFSIRSSNSIITLLLLSTISLAFIFSILGLTFTIIMERKSRKELIKAKTIIIDEMWSNRDKFKELMASAIEKYNQEGVEFDKNSYATAFKAVETGNQQEFRLEMIKILDSYADKFNIPKSSVEAMVAREKLEKKSKNEKEADKNNDKSKMLQINNFLNVNSKLDMNTNMCAGKVVDNHKVNINGVKGEAFEPKYLYHK